MKGVLVKLIAGDQTELSGANIKVESAAKISCFVDLTGKSNGIYDLAVFNPDGQKVSLKNGFTVVTFVPASQNYVLKSIFFDFDQTKLRADQIPVLDENLKFLNEQSKLYIILGGHADERGSKEYNLQLSGERAETIKLYLINQGINAERIVIYTYGEDYPAKESHDESSWEYNRRADILVWDTELNKEQVLAEIANQ